MPNCTNISIQSNTLCSGFYQNPLMWVLAIFSTGTYAIIGTTRVESETFNEKYHEKKIFANSYLEAPFHYNHIVIK